MKFYLCVSFAFVIFLFSSSAQTRSVFSSIRPQLEKVINDYSNQFKYTKGEQTESAPNLVEYTSKVEIKNAIETKVIGFVTKTKTHWVWESKLFVTEEIAELKKQYKYYYNDVSGKSPFNKGSINSLKPTGPYESPSEELRLWTSQFRMNDVTGEYSNLVVDLVAEYVGFEWTLYLRVYDKERDEEMKPTKDKNERYKF